MHEVITRSFFVERAADGEGKADVPALLDALLGRFDQVVGAGDGVDGVVEAGLNLDGLAE